jgi:hypothetical protein
VTLLMNLISKFKKKGDDAQAEHLYNILSKCVERSTIFAEPEGKGAMLKGLKEQLEAKK